MASPPSKPENEAAVAAVGHLICAFANGSCLCSRSPTIKVCVSVMPKAAQILRIARKELEKVPSPPLSPFR